MKTLLLFLVLFFQFLLSSTAVQRENTLEYFFSFGALSSNLRSQLTVFRDIALTGVHQFEDRLYSGPEEAGFKICSFQIESDILIRPKNQQSVGYIQHFQSFNLNYPGLHLGNERYFSHLKDHREDWGDSDKGSNTTKFHLVSKDDEFLIKSAENTWQASSLTSMEIFDANPYWMQWWIILLLVVLFTFLIYGIYKYRLNQILYIQQVKNTISADLHDEIGSKLTNIQMLSAISKNNLNGIDPFTTLGKIEKEAQASAEALDEIVWNINKTDESLLEIFARMRRYASDSFEADDILYRIHVSQGFEGKRMCMQKRRELLLIFKELLTNVRKHSKASNVMIKIMPVNDGLALKVKDDGVGFDANQEHSRNGIRNISFRMDKWNGKMDLNSQLGQGTTIEVWLPFNCS